MSAWMQRARDYFNEQKMNVLSKIEDELRKRALEQFTRELNTALDKVRHIIAQNSSTLFNKIPDDLNNDIINFRDKIVDKLGPIVQDEAVRKGSELLLKAMSGE